MVVDFRKATVVPLGLEVGEKLLIPIQGEEKSHLMTN